MIKKFLLLALFAVVTCLAFGQDDDLPPPSSKPDQRQDDSNLPPKDNDFKGFKSKKKVDLSKFIIEPNFNLSIGQGRIDFGLSPYVGYQVWQPQKQDGTGLYLGGGLTYFYSGFKNIAFTDPTGSRVYYANANWHTFGGGVFAQYNIWRGLFARVKLEVLHRRLDDFYNGGVYVQPLPNNNYKVIIPKVDKTIPALLVGAGYNLLQSKNFFFPLMISYNVLYPITDKNYSIYSRGIVVQLGFINIF